MEFNSFFFSEILSLPYRFQLWLYLLHQKIDVGYFHMTRGFETHCIIFSQRLLCYCLIGAINGRLAYPESLLNVNFSKLQPFSQQIVAFQLCMHVVFIEIVRLVFKISLPKLLSVLLCSASQITLQLCTTRTFQLAGISQTGPNRFQQTSPSATLTSS